MSLIAPIHWKIFLEFNKNLTRDTTHHTLYVGMSTSIQLQVLTAVQR